MVLVEVQSFEFDVINLRAEIEVEEISSGRPSSNPAQPQREQGQLDLQRLTMLEHVEVAC